MVTDEQAKRIYDEMVDLWGDNLPNPDHEPRRTEQYMKMFRYCHPERLKRALDGQGTSEEA